MTSRAPTPSSTPVFPWWPRILALTVLTLAIVVTYLTSFNAEWTSEARDTIRDAPRYSNAQLRNLWPLVQPEPGNNALEWGRALPRFSFWADRVAWGVDNADAYHTTNILLHWLNALLLFAIALNVMRNVWAGFFVAAIFAVHPVGTDAVSNIAGRPELLGAAAILGGLWCCVRSLATRRWTRIGWLLLLSFCQAAGLASHESAWTLAAVLTVYHLSFGVKSERWAGCWRSLAAVSLPLIGGGLILFRHSFKSALPLPETALASNPLLSLDALHARLTALKCLGRYLFLTIWPQTLLPDYSFNQVPLLTRAAYLSEGWKAALTLIVLVVLMIVAVCAYRRSRPLFFFTLLFFLTLLPVSNLVRLGPAIMLERNLYLPLAGFAGWLVCVVYVLMRRIVPWLANYHWARQEWPAFAARMTLSALLLCFGTRAFARNLDWQNDERLWVAAADDGPNNYRAHLRLAAVLLLKDRKDLAGAIREGENALRIVQQPGWPEPHLPREVLLRLGRAYRQQAESIGNPDPNGSAKIEAEGWFNKATAMLEVAAAADRVEKERCRGSNALLRFPAIYLNLGLLQTRAGQREAALASFQTLEQDAPSSPDIYLDIARACLALNETERGAIASAQAILLRAGWKQPFLVLAELYKDDTGDHCNLATPDEETFRINASCSVLRECLNVAYLRLIKNHLLIGDRRMAFGLKRKALEKDNLPRGPFDQLLPESAQNSETIAP